MNVTGQFERNTWFVPFVACARLGLPWNWDTRDGARGFGGEAVNLGKATAPVSIYSRGGISARGLRASGFRKDASGRHGSPARGVSHSGQGVRPADFLNRAVGAVLPGKAMTRRATPLANEGFSLCDQLGRVRQNLPKQVAYPLHVASVGSVMTTTSHHRRSRKCAPSRRSQEFVS